MNIPIKAISAIATTRSVLVYIKIDLPGSEAFHTISDFPRLREESATDYLARVKSKFSELSVTKGLQKSLDKEEASRKKPLTNNL